MFAKVAPLRRLPNNLAMLDYRAAENQPIQPGSLVKIPFRRSEIFGIVLKVRGKPDIPEEKLATIKEAVWDTPLLSEAYLRLARQISATYGAPIGPILSGMCPPLQKRKLAAQDLSALAARAHEYSRSYLWYQTHDQKIQWNSKRNDPGQTLIIVPEHRHLTEWSADAVFHTKLTQRQKFETYFAARNGLAKTIVGTRAALFLPFSNLSRIIIDFEHSAHHKNWDQAPRYHSAEVAQWIARALPCRLTLASHTPSVKSARQLQEHPLMRALPKPGVILVDQRQEYQKKNFSVLSDDLVSAIHRAKKQDKSVLCLTHRRGSFSVVRCADCGRTERCQHCHLPLVHHGDTQTLNCHPCNKICKPSSICPQCSGASQTFHSPGTQHVTAALSDLNLLKVIRVDGDTDTPKPSAEPHILVGTSAALASVNWSTVGAASILDADSMLSIPEHRASDEFFALVRELQYFLPKKTPVLVHTKEPSRALIHSLTTAAPEYWYARELKIREALKYPPFMSVLKLSIWENSTNYALSRLRSVAQQALKLTESQKNVIVTLPYSSHPRIKRGAYGAVLLIRAPQKEQFASLLEQLTLPKGIKIDIDPLTFQS